MGVYDVVVYYLFEKLETGNWKLETGNWKLENEKRNLNNNIFLSLSSFLYYLFIVCFLYIAILGTPATAVWTVLLTPSVKFWTLLVMAAVAPVTDG
jgi:hypothetical protein